jgi:hypothetical protein
MAPLGQKKYLTLPFIKWLGTNKLLTICPNNLVAVGKKKTHKLKEKTIFWNIPQSIVWELPASSYVSIERCVFLCFTVQRRFKINLISVWNWFYFVYGCCNTAQDYGQLQSISITTSWKGRNIYVVISECCYNRGV